MYTVSGPDYADSVSSNIYQDMWAAACVLDPVISSIVLATSVNVEYLKTKGEALVRRMIRDIRPASGRSPN